MKNNILNNEENNSNNKIPENSGSKCLINEIQASDANNQPNKNQLTQEKLNNNKATIEIEMNKPTQDLRNWLEPSTSNKKTNTVEEQAQDIEVMM